ncbi:mycothiol transferase [Streptomyces sp. NPDC054919]
MDGLFRGGGGHLAGNHRGPALEAPCRRADLADRNLQWVLLHMIEETARHAGHADMIQESIDGRTGIY